MQPTSNFFAAIRQIIIFIFRRFVSQISIDILHSYERHYILAPVGRYISINIYIYIYTHTYMLFFEFNINEREIFSCMKN